MLRCAAKILLLMTYLRLLFLLLLSCQGGIQCSRLFIIHWLSNGFRQGTLLFIAMWTSKSLENGAKYAARFHMHSDMHAEEKGKGLQRTTSAAGFFFFFFFLSPKFRSSSPSVKSSTASANLHSQLLRANRNPRLADCTFLLKGFLRQSFLFLQASERPSSAVAENT